LQETDTQMQDSRLNVQTTRPNLQATVLALSLVIAGCDPSSRENCGVVGRLRAAAALTAGVRALAAAGIAQRHPSADAATSSVAASRAPCKASRARRTTSTS
jgi:hypothetical protein